MSNDYIHKQIDIKAHNIQWNARFCSVILASAEIILWYLFFSFYFIFSDKFNFCIYWHIENASVLTHLNKEIFGAFSYYLNRYSHSILFNEDLTWKSQLTEKIITHIEKSSFQTFVKWDKTFCLQHFVLRAIEPGKSTIVSDAFHHFESIFQGRPWNRCRKITRLFLKKKTIPDMICMLSWKSLGARHIYFLPEQFKYRCCLYANVYVMLNVQRVQLKLLSG